MSWKLLMSLLWRKREFRGQDKYWWWGDFFMLWDLWWDMSCTPQHCPPTGEASLSSALRWPLFPTIRQRLTLGLSKSLAAGNNPDVLLVAKFYQFYEILNLTFTLSPRCVNALVNQSADCSCTWMPKYKCRVSAVGVECGSEVVELRLHILKHLWESC